MKKIFKSILCLFALATPTIVLTTTSCGRPIIDNQDFTEEQKKRFEYINEREISIAAIKGDDGDAGFFEKSGTFGTAWFYEYLGGNKYEMVTNYHVWAGIVDAINSCQQGEKCVLASLTTSYKGTSLPLSYFDDYVINEYLDDNAITALNPVYVKTGNVAVNFPTTLDAYMDMTAFTIDFTDSIEPIASIGDVTSLKNQLTNLQKKYPNKGDKMFTLADSVKKDENIYIAGYPWADAKGDSRHGTNFKMCASTSNKYTAGKMNDTECTNTFSDLSFVTNQNQWWLPWDNNFPLGGGASGSMAIDENYNLCGIFWGGASPSEQTGLRFRGCFATFEKVGKDATGSFFDLVDQAIAGK